MGSLAERKSSFPRQPGKICLNHCRISPTYRPAAIREGEYALAMADGGTDYFLSNLDVLSRLKVSAATLIGTLAENMTFVKSSSEGVNIVAQGFRFQAGDEIVSYEREYPSNHYPWRLAEHRQGAVLKLLPDRNILGREGDGGYCAWTMEDLEKTVGPKTKILAISHVQFVSGYAADLEALGRFCRERDIFFVVDAAQSLGSLPIDVEKMNISALIASGWKWLMGPMGGAILYTSKEFREQVDVIFPAALSMKHYDELDLSWNPDDSGNKFAGSAVPMSLAAALGVCLDELFVPLAPSEISAEIFALQDQLIEGLKNTGYRPLVFKDAHRSGILSVFTPRPPAEIVAALATRNITSSARVNYVRLAPHFYNSPSEIETTIAALRAAEA